MRKDEVESFVAPPAQSSSSGMGCMPALPFCASATDGMAGSVSPSRQVRVLIAEDDALIALVLAELLEEMGFEVCASEATEASAITAALHARPNLMIVDARLKKGSGIRAVESILRDHFVPHIFTTGYQLTGCLLHPRAIVLQKPFLESDLARAIKQALSPRPS